MSIADGLDSSESGLLPMSAGVPVFAFFGWLSESFGSAEESTFSLSGPFSLGTDPWAEALRPFGFFVLGSLSFSFSSSSLSSSGRLLDGLR